MELYQLEYLQEIVASESLQAAAKKLHVSQPSLSRCIKAVEEELGAPLFDRVGRNIVLNETGRIALRRVGAALDATAAIKRDVEAFVRDREQTVNLYAPVPLGDDERVLFGFKRAHPEVRLRVGVAPASSLMNEVPDLTFFASPIIHDEPNYLMLGEEDVVLGVPASSELAALPAVALADVADRDFIFPMPCSYRDLCESMFIEIGAEPHIVLEDQSYIQVMRSVALGFGYALVPSITWSSSAEPDVVGVPLSDVHRKRHLYLKWREGSLPAGAALLLRDYLIEHFTQVCGRTPAAR